MRIGGGRGEMDDTLWERYLLEIAGQLVTKGPISVVPIVGAGVSQATAGIPGWTALFQHGFDHVARIKPDQAAALDLAKRSLAQSRFTFAGQLLMELLDAPHGEFQEWLIGLFRVPPIMCDRET